MNRAIYSISWKNATKLFLCFQPQYLLQAFVMQLHNCLCDIKNVLYICISVNIHHCLVIIMIMSCNSKAVTVVSC